MIGPGTGSESPAVPGRGGRRKSNSSGFRRLGCASQQPRRLGASAVFVAQAARDDCLSSLPQRHRGWRRKQAGRSAQARCLTEPALSTLARRRELAGSAPASGRPRLCDRSRLDAPERAAGAPARHGAGGTDPVALREAPARLVRRGPAHARCEARSAFCAMAGVRACGL